MRARNNACIKYLGATGNRAFIAMKLFGKSGVSRVVAHDSSGTTEAEVRNSVYGVFGSGGANEATGSVTLYGSGYHYTFTFTDSSNFALGGTVTSSKGLNHGVYLFELAEI